MSVTKTVVNRPTTVAIIFALLIALGLYAVVDLAIDLYPEIEPPVLLLFTDYPGAGPEEVEKSVTRPLEGGLSNVGNIEEITSTSAEGNSMIQIEFTWGTDMSEAANDVRDKLEMVKAYLPEEATTPQIFKFDPSMIPILHLNVSGNRTPEEIREISEKIIQPRLEQVEGVALVSISGGRERIIRVEVPQNRLEAYGLTLTQIQGMLQGQNVQLSGGAISDGNINYLISTAGEYESIQEIRDTVIAYKGSPAQPSAASGNPTKVVRLGDIANVFDGFRDEDNVIFINGRPGVYLTVQKQSGTNSVQTADNVLARIEQINRELPAGIEVAVIYDTTKIIRASLQQVSSSAITGGILAVLILLIFLRSFKTTLIIGLTIPISFIITLMLMYFAGLTLNIMTLAGLALGIGMLVDNSIVILENIYRYREKGAKLKTSAVIGTQEMINAIVASTLTTICVFAPLAVFKSQLAMIGELFSGLSFTVVISLLSSLLVAMFLVPVLSSKYLPIRSNRQRPRTGLSKRLDEVLGGFFESLDELYRRALKKVLRRRVLTVLIVLVIFVASLGLLTIAGFEFMPDMESDYIELSAELPLGTDLEITKSVMQRLELIARDEIQGFESIVVSAGERSFFGFLGGLQSHKGSLSITLPPYAQRIDTSTEVEEKLRSHFDEFPSVVFEFTEGGGPGGGGSPIDILVKSDDLDLAKETAKRIQEMIREQLPEITEPVINLQEGLPQLDIVIDRERAYDLGLTMASIGQEIRANIDGATASRFNDDGNEYDIVVILEERDRDEIPDLNKIFVVNAMGVRIPLSSFASTRKTSGPVSINRENQTRTIHVQGGMAPGAQLQQVELDLRRAIADNIPVDENVVIEYSGDYAELMEYGFKFVVILIISILLVFGVMASQFESFLDPFIIFFTIPLVLIGVIGIYVGTGQSFSIFTAVGLVMLVGIVVNNGIVLVDYINLLRKRGMGINDACIAAGGNRLRPILMTTLTTVLALVPMAFFPGEGAELVQPIGKAVVGGLSAATLLTLFLVPVLYSLFNGRAEKRAAKREAKREARRAERHQRELSPIEGQE